MDGISWEGGEANPVQSSIDVPASPKKKNNEMKMPWKEKKRWLSQQDQDAFQSQTAKKKKKS